jgi:histidinol-phosphate aminotransferase
MMSNNLASIKTRVRELRPYSLGPERARIKLNQNENAWDIPSKIKYETLNRLNDCAWSRYPNFTPQRLHERLAEFSGWTADGIVAGNGSNELIQALLMVTIGAGKRVLISEPTFALYRQIATVLEGEVVTRPLKEDLGYDISALTDAVGELQPEVTIVCSPNNPTGCELSDADLRSLLESTGGLVVVDEAYHEFAEHTVVPLLREYDNLVVLRTFSKAMAMAGLRAGYLMAAPELTREISKAVLPYNLNVISQTAAEVAIEMYEDELRPLVRQTIAERGRLHDALKSIDGLTPVASRANFILVRSAVGPRQVFEELLSRNILIRDVSSYPMLSEYFRVSVGTSEESDLLIGGLREILGVRWNT